jgi:hypothetical protein
MKWTLISYTEIEMPLAPHVSVHVVGILESERGERAIAKISAHRKLHIGMSGELMRTDHEGLNVFLPGYK